MADNGCVGCNSAITQQKANDEKTIQIAKQMAKEQNKTIALYRDEEGTLRIATEPGMPITGYISPFMQNAVS
jgi:hypothetical protein